MKLHHFLPPPHLVALFATSALAFAAGALVMARRRVPVQMAVLARQIKARLRGIGSRGPFGATRFESRGGGSSRFETHSAFDAYRAATLDNLEAEAKAFRIYLDRLRRTRDREEFELFLSSRRDGGGARG